MIIGHSFPQKSRLGTSYSSSFSGMERPFTADVPVISSNRISMEQTNER